MNFDPDDITSVVDGLFGLPSDPNTARVLVIPAPFDGTATYAVGAADGPGAILAASNQIDLFDLQFGRVYESGIAMADEIEGLRKKSRRVRALADPILQRGSVTKDDSATIDEINQVCATVEKAVHGAASAALGAGQIPALLGGEHSLSQGAIRACAEWSRAHGDGKLGLLQIDAHMDLHPAYASMVYSHASIIRNSLEMFEGVSTLVQVGIRDVAEREVNYMRDSAGRIRTFFDLDLARRLDEGASWKRLCDEIIEPLPRDVYVTFDIDGLDPSLCPHTGTPVPGGLSFSQACVLLETLARSGRRIIGFDLVEVAPSPGRAGDWDANVGARILYKLCGAAITSNPRS